MHRSKGRRSHAAIALGLLFSSCTTRAVTIYSEPTGAEILVDSRSVGTAPVVVPVRGRWVYQAAARHTVTARMGRRQAGLYPLEPTEVFWPGAVGCVLLLGIGCPWLAQIPDELTVRLPGDEPWR